MTREEYDHLMRDLDARRGPVEHRVDRELRELRERDEIWARERELQSRSPLTEAWQVYIDQRLEIERARLGQVILQENDVRSEALGEILAEVRHDFEKALADLRREVMKQAAVNSGEVAELPNVIDLPNPLRRA